MGKLRPGRCRPLWLHIWSLRLDLLVPLHLASVLKANIALSALGWVIPAGYLALTLGPPTAQASAPACLALSFVKAEYLCWCPQSRSALFSLPGAVTKVIRGSLCWFTVQECTVMSVVHHSGGQGGSVLTHPQFKSAVYHSGGSKWRGHGAPTAQECSPSQWGGS